MKQRSFASLVSESRKKPTRRVSGVDQAKLERYGADFLTVITATELTAGL